SKMSAVLAFLRFLYQARFLVVDPGRDIQLPRLPNKLLPRLPSEEEVLRLLEAPDTTTPLGLRDRAILELLYSSALRNSELRQLGLTDVDLDRLEVRVLYGKGGKQRVVPLGEPAAAWVEEYLRHGRGFLLKDTDHGRLFSSLRGDPISVESLVDLCRKHARAAGLGRVTPHLLRHCCATHMLAREANLRHLQELLGHSSAATTQRYTQVQLSDLRAVHQRCHPREAF
ncbi:MAG: tyrosine-type recombinase/integrase, partial [Candidatus Eremiobacteraeota bacterium]|nr:tyrosine-type recombinase/integrase [Candidatus Eremiobacteraeota bacterium]